jgi:hypothetical protein
LAPDTAERGAMSDDTTAPRLSLLQERQSPLEPLSNEQVAAYVHGWLSAELEVIAEQTPAEIAESLRALRAAMVHFLSRVH